jgi:hypothetical protein
MGKEKDWNTKLKKKIDYYDPDTGGFAWKVKRLVRKGADPNMVVDEHGTTLLMEEAEKGYYTPVKALIKNGANVTTVNKFGVTVLMCAAKRDNPDIIPLLIENGADVNAQSIRGNNALIHAVANDYGFDNLQNIKRLVEAGADINQVNEAGNSVLHFAVSYGYYDIVKYLLEHGADISLTSEPLMQLIDEDHESSKKMKQLLEEYKVESKAFTVQYKVKIKCKECGTFIPLNGPAEELECHECYTIHKISDRVWESLFSDSKYDEYSTEISMAYEELIVMGLDLKHMAPQCQNTKCKAELVIDSNILGKESVLICPKCKKEHLSYPVPEFMEKYSVSFQKPVQIISGENFQSRQDLAVKSIAVKCISCGASMKVSHKTPRICTCEHCQTQQYLPDGIWKQLHPVKRRKPWYIIYAD